MTGMSTLRHGGGSRYSIGDTFRIPASAAAHGGLFLRLAEEFSDGAFGADVLERPGDSFALAWVEVVPKDVAALERVADLHGPVKGRA